MIAAGTVTRVQVTAEDIAHGERGNCNECPVARAIMRAVPGSAPNVGYDIVSAGIGGMAADLPGDAVDFIDRYDQEVGAEPFEFDLTWREIGS